MKDYEFQCSYCGHQVDGDVFHNPPDVCKICTCTNFKPIVDEDGLIDDVKENEHDFDYLARKG